MENIHQNVERAKALYPAGTRVRLVSMDDPYPVPVGTKETVTDIDDMANIHVKWDNGSSLALIYGVDEFTVVSKDGGAI